MKGLIPLICERSVVEPGSSKISRLERAIIEASKQCRRARLMVLDSPMRWGHFAELNPGSLKPRGFLKDFRLSSKNSAGRARDSGRRPGRWLYSPGTRAGCTDRMA